MSKDIPFEEFNPSLSNDYIGSFVTDRSYYFGKCNCELEIEFQDRERAEEALVTLSIGKAKIHQDGKYDRFVTELQQLRRRLLN